IVCGYPASLIVYALCVLGSAAGVIFAWPKPDHTGVLGPKLCVRSTNCFDAITRYARARSLCAYANDCGKPASASSNKAEKKRSLGAMTPLRQIVKPDDHIPDDEMRTPCRFLHDRPFIRGRTFRMLPHVRTI